MIFFQTLDFIAIIFGFVLYFLALGVSYLICVYPDPVKKSNLTDKEFVENVKKNGIFGNRKKRYKKNEKTVFFLRFMKDLNLNW